LHGRPTIRTAGQFRRRLVDFSRAEDNSTDGSVPTYPAVDNPGGSWMIETWNFHVFETMRRASKKPCQRVAVTLASSVSYILQSTVPKLDVFRSPLHAFMFNMLLPLGISLTML
jgi:hypothetical protein